jgi:hypothetical protein
MKLQRLTAPPAPATGVRWRDLYEAGRFTQRPLEAPNRMRQAAGERGLFISLGAEQWETWDEQGAICPVVFDRDEPVWRDETSFQPWATYEVPVTEQVSESRPLYSPWQLLPLNDVLLGESLDVPLRSLVDPSQREPLLTQLEPLLSAQLAAWQAVHEWWLPTLKLLVSLQNRFWPFVTGSFVVPSDPETGRSRYDIVEVEVARFDPAEVLYRHDIFPEQLAQIYEWLVERGARIDGGHGPFTTSGDQWARLRMLADRRERRRMRGPARAALDFYEAAEMIARFWWEMTGRSLPGITATANRRSTTPIDHLTGEEPAFQRSRDALRAEMIDHGLWPARIHTVVEGRTEEAWVTGLLRTFFGAVPQDLHSTDIHGSGGAAQVEPIVQALSDYARHAALIVDAEGEMAKHVNGMIATGVLDPHDVLIVDSSFEEANFTDGELVRVAKHLAAHPPGDRPKVRLRLTAKQLRSKHDELVAAARVGQEPGLARTLLDLLRDPDHGPVNLTKTELAEGLLTYALADMEKNGIDDASARRPVIRFIRARIADPLANATWR